MSRKRQITVSDEAKSALIRLKAEKMQLGKSVSYSEIILDMEKEHNQKAESEV